MEHPSGEFASAVGAMAGAIARLRALPMWNRWITFCAQGQALSPDSIHTAEVRLLSDVLELDTPLDLPRIAALAKVPRDIISEAGTNRYSLALASPLQFAQILDAIFRHVLAIQPFDDEGDYAVGAEW